MDMGVIDTVGTCFGARAAAKGFRMLLVLCVERSFARFSFFELLRIVMCESERDWRTEERESGCASRFSLSESLRMMWRGERDWRTLGDDKGVDSGNALAGFLRMPYARGDTG